MKPFAFLLLALPALAADRLVSNFTYAVSPGEAVGELRALARGDAASGVSVVTLDVVDGTVQVQGISSALLDGSYAMVHDHVLNSVTGEFRRTPWAIDGSGKWWLPYFGKDNGSFVEPQGIVSFGDGAFQTFPLATDTLALDTSLSGDPLLRTVDAMVPDGELWWLAQGAGGLLHYNMEADTGSRWLLNVKDKKLVLAAQADSIRKSTYSPLFGVAKAPGGNALWLASEKGLWLRAANGSLSQSGVKALDTGRVTGIWSGGSPVQLWLETSRRTDEETTVGSLWCSLDSGKTFQSILPEYDSLNLSISSIAFMGKQAWLAVQRTEGSVSGLLRMDSARPVAWTDKLPDSATSGASRWIWGVDAKVVDRDVYITGACAFPLAQNATGLAVATDGGGVSVSADSGKTWKMILNQVAVGGNLSEIRMVPSVLRGSGATALVAYQLSQTAEITIEIFSYDMKKVRTLVKNAPRLSDPVRSSDPRADIWDGTDDAGRPVAMGTYYVKVRDNHGHVGWGKVMSLGGRR